MHDFRAGDVVLVKYPGGAMEDVRVLAILRRPVRIVTEAGTFKADSNYRYVVDQTDSLFVDGRARMHRIANVIRLRAA